MAKKKQNDPQQAESSEETLPLEEEPVESGCTQEEDTHRELDECRQQLIRLQADFDNYRKRMAKEQSRMYQDAVDGFVCNLLPVMDDLERAIRVAQDRTADKNLLAGVELIHRRLQDVLDKEGIVPMECVGEPFDPDCHQAVQRLCVPEQPENTVVEEALRGYRRRERVLRPAMVVVSTQDEE